MARSLDGAAESASMDLTAKESSFDQDSRHLLLRDFLRLKLGARRLYLHRALAPHSGALAARLSTLMRKPGQGIGNRGSAFELRLAGTPALFARCFRRGGLVRFLVSDIYFGAIPRPLRELRISLAARRRGIAVVEPMGAMVEWVAPMVYRGCFLTRAIDGMTLWQFLKVDDDRLVRLHVIEQARLMIDTMHRRGLCHSDLNLHNLFVTKVGESFAVMALDLDKARLHPPPLDPALILSNLARLARSARKLDPYERYLDSYTLARLTAPATAD
jgi:hypothetical protein